MSDAVERNNEVILTGCSRSDIDQMLRRSGTYASDASHPPNPPTSVALQSRIRSMFTQHCVYSACNVKHDAAVAIINGQTQFTIGDTPGLSPITWRKQPIGSRQKLQIEYNR